MANFSLGICRVLNPADARYFFLIMSAFTLVSMNSEEPSEISVYGITFGIFLFSSHTLYLNHCPDTGDNESRFEIIISCINQH